MFAVNQSNSSVRPYFEQAPCGVHPEEDGEGAAHHDNGGPRLGPVEEHGVGVHVEGGAL